MATRHDRQIRFPGIGADGQVRLAQRVATVVGVGALGAIAAEQLVRAGVGTVRLIDRDLVEDSNLQRQALYREADAEACLPKAVAAATRLCDIDARIRIESHVEELRASNALALLRGSDVVIDGLDSFPARHLLNEACCALGIPFVHGACVGAYGLSFAIVPGRTPCLRCVQSELPMPGDGPTCDTAGIIAPAAHLVAAWQVAEALKLLVGADAALRRDLWACDLWQGTFQRLDLRAARDPRCIACGTVSGSATRPLLTAGDDPAIVLCGRDAIQIRLPGIDLAALRTRLAADLIASNDYLIRFRIAAPEAEVAITATCFRDGRVLVQGLATPQAARAFCDRWIGR